MNIIFIGSTVDRKTLNLLADASIAGNKMQLGFIRGFVQNNMDVSVISVEAQAMWKFNHKPVFVSAKKLAEEDIVIQTIPYINLPIIKQCWIYAKLRKQLKKCLISKDTILIVYNTMSMFALPVLKAASKYKCKAVSIVADLPIKTKKNWLRRMEDRKQEKLIAEFDGLVPLTKHIPEDFAPDVPYCVIEAGCDKQEHLDEKVERTDDKHRKIVFSGTLNSLSGIELLIEAMDYLKEKNIQLHIYGAGPLEEKVRIATANPSIIYHGRVNNEEMLQIQRRADLLVCPRRTDDYTTKYTFPSKVLEYACSGVPVLSNRLPGIPEEYEEYINYSESERVEDWIKVIIDILEVNTEVYWRKAQKAKDKILQTKTWKYQSQKVLHFLKTI